MELTIEYINKNELKPYVHNAKIHTEEQVGQIRKSIEQFGFNDPVAVWKGNEIIEGHGRLLAAMQIESIKQVPVIRLDGLTDKQRKAYMLAHNKLTTNTGFDVDILRQEIIDIADDIDLTDLGFNEREIIEFTIDDDVFDNNPSSGSSGTVAASQPVQNGSEFTPVSPPTYNDYTNYESEPSTSASEKPPTNAKVQEGEEIDLSVYKERANKRFTTQRIIIVYKSPEEEMFLKEILNAELDKPLGVVYDAEKLMKMAIKREEK